jgi:hypothetical protein
VLDRREAVHRQVEQLDLDAGLADVDAHDVPVRRVDAQQHARPAAVRLDLARFRDEPFFAQFGGHVADRGRAQSGELAEFVPRQRAVEVQFRQQEGTVVPPQVTDGGALARHGQPI